MNKKEFYVRGAKEEFISSYEEACALLEKGEANRHFAATVMNHSSSRSHTLFRLVNSKFMKFVETSDSSSNKNYHSILNFVDLAGSERGGENGEIAEGEGNCKESGLSTPLSSVSRNTSKSRFVSNSTEKLCANKERLNESRFINRSLFYLTQVISKKANKESHIPYRNSPLTKLLRSSLGGNSRTVVILCVNPCESQFEQTLSTLRFGLNANKIRNKIEPKFTILNSNGNQLNVSKDLEERIKVLEQEKEENLSQIDSLLGIIETLERKLGQESNTLDSKPDIIRLKKEISYLSQFH